MPTARRAPTATLVRRGGERLLFDCGEGTQRQLLRSDVGLVELREIFLTHFHADHYLGLPGMLKTFALRGPRAAADDLRAAPAWTTLLHALRRDLRPADVRGRAGRARPRARCCRATATSCATFAVDHGRVALGYALVEDERPGRFDVATADALGIPFGPERGALQARRAGRRSRTAASSRPTRCSARRGRGGSSSSPATRLRPTASSRQRGRRPARARGDLLRGRGRTGARDRALDRARRGRASRATPASSCSRSRISRAATSAATSSARRAPSSPRRSFPATST